MGESKLKKANDNLTKRRTLWLCWSVRRLILEESSSCHTYCDTEPPLFISLGRQKHLVVFTNNQGFLLRVYSILHSYPHWKEVSVGWDVKWCSVSKNLFGHKRQFFWILKKSRLMKTARKFKKFKTNHFSMKLVVSAVIFSSDQIKKDIHNHKYFVFRLYGKSLIRRQFQSMTWSSWMRTSTH